MDFRFNNFNGRIWIKPDKSDAPLIEVDSDGIPIKVRIEQRGDKKVYVVGYFPYSPPSVNLSANPSILEIGQSAEVAFSGTINVGSDDITLVEVSPIVEFSHVGNNVTFSAIVNGDSIGTKGVHNLIVTDASNNTVSSSRGVSVQHRYRIGTIGRDSILFVEQESKLSGSMRGAYGSLTGYNIPVGQNHIAWLIPDGETMPTPTDANGFPWEVVDGGTQSIVNDHGYEVLYRVIKTKNFYVGESTVNLKV